MHNHNLLARLRAFRRGGKCWSISRARNASTSVRTEHAILDLANSEAYDLDMSILSQFHS